MTTSTTQRDGQPHGSEETPTRIRVLVVDDNAIVRMGVVSLLGTLPDIEVVAEAWDGESAIKYVRLHRPQVVLLDVRMPGTDGVTAAEEISGSARVLMLTYTDTPEVVGAALRAGATGYLVHGEFTPEQLHRAIQAAAAGTGSFSSGAMGKLQEALAASHRHEAEKIDRESWGLTPRESEILGLVAEGLSNAKIARQLFLSEKTIKNHLHKVYGKIGADNRAQATAAWLGSSD